MRGVKGAAESDDGNQEGRADCLIRLSGTGKNGYSLHDKTYKTLQRAIPLIDLNDAIDSKKIVTYERMLLCRLLATRSSQG